MASINVEVVREYLEHKGFFVRLLKKFVLTGAEKDEMAAIDLACWNPNNVYEDDSLPFVLDGISTCGVSRSIVGIRGWHTDVFSPSVLVSFPQIFNFVELNEKRVSKTFFNGLDFKRILVVPMLPQREQIRERSIQMLMQRNVTNVLEFRTLLMELAEESEINRNYIESDILQILRLLKRYDCLKGKQLELFE